MINPNDYNINSLSIVHEAVYKYFEVDYLYPFIKSTDRKSVYVRQLFHYVAKNTCNRNITTFKNIACYLDDILEPYNHATVINSCKKIDGYLTYDKQVMKDVKGIVKMLPKD